jgi:hypothetical protein
MFFPTPFLRPFSAFKVDGIGWDSPLILVPNFSLFAIVYFIWLFRQRQNKIKRDAW